MNKKRIIKSKKFQFFTAERELFQAMKTSNKQSVPLCQSDIPTEDAKRESVEDGKDCQKESEK